LRDLLIVETQGSRDNARILTLGQNDFAMALTCDIKQAAD
jgi:hypothetical protein